MDLDPLVTALEVSAVLAYLDGDHTGARALLEEIQPHMITSDSQLAECCRILILCGSLEHAQRLANQTRSGPPRFEYQVLSSRAHIADATGDLDRALQLYRNAADHWRAFGNPLELAHTLAGQGRILEACGRAAEAVPQLNEVGDLTERLQLAGPVAPLNLALAFRRAET